MPATQTAAPAEYLFSTRAEIIHAAHQDAIQGINPFFAAVLLQMETACTRIVADIERDGNNEQAKIVPTVNELMLAMPSVQDLRELDACMAVEFKHVLHSKREPLQPLLDDRLRAAQSLASFRRTARITSGATDRLRVSSIGGRAYP